LAQGQDPSRLCPFEPRSPAMPVKFDDLSKAATEVLNDDYQVSGHQLKAKQKTSFDGAVVTTAVDLFGKDCATPAKLTWKFPKPFGIAGVCVDKLEMDKAGKFKFEAVIDNAAHTVQDLKLEIKSDLADMAKTSGGFTFTGLKDTQIKLESKQDLNFAFEATRSIDCATLGVKCGQANLTAPDLGAKVAYGPVIASILAKDKFSVFSAGACYKASNDLKVAATFEQSKAPKWALGVVYNLQKGTTLKAKVQQDTSVSCGVKHELVKGFTLLAGGKYDTAGNKHTYGLQVSIE